MSRFYVTTPIYYVNDVPHLGTAYTTIAADVLARVHRLRGHRTHLLTGLDEHGLKIERAAAERGKEPRAYVDEMAAPFREAWDALDVRTDDFIRTTEPRHVERVQRLWKKVQAKGDIYEGVYEDWYCVGCEAYYTQKDLAEGNLCPVHGRPVERLKEPSYFFKLSAYEKPLLDLYESHPEFVAPESRLNEVRAFVKGGLRDLSISRTTFQWGVPVPGDSRHIMYVWFDALANYLTALGDEGSEAYTTFWPPDLHLVGKDILRFHAVYWPAFLMSAGLPLPRQVFAHGWLTVNGQKMSKSMRNVVEPRALAREYGPDAVRFYLMREITFGLDGDFSHEALVARWNSDLADNVGNLANRTTSLIRKFFGGRIPDPQGPGDAELREAFDAALPRIEAAFDAVAPHKAIEEILALGRTGNVFVDRRAPWALAKQGKTAELASVLWSVLELCRAIAVMLLPVVPRRAAGLLGQLGVGEPRWPAKWGEATPGQELPAPSPAFPKFEPDRAAEILARLGVTTAPPPAPEPAKAAAPAPSPAPSPAPGVITYDDFAKVALVVGEVLTAERVPKSDKLLKLQVAVGEDRPRQIVAGIGKAYAPEALVGKRVAVVANLAPAKLMGQLSEGMLLAAGGPETLKLVGFDGDVAVGTRIK